MPETKPTVPTIDSAKETKTAAVIGAQAVADAVAKVATAAVAEVQKTKFAPEDNRIVITGTPGGRFELRGDGFGSSGSLLIGGKQARTTAWGTMRIEGWLPEGITDGDELVIWISKETQLHGVYHS